MGLFTQKKQLKFKEIPSTPEQKQGRALLTDLMNTELEFTPQGVAGLTGNEQQIQNQMPGYLNNITSDYQAGRSYLNEVLAGDYDPRTSDYYKGLRAEQNTLKANAQGDIRRQAQKAGMARSTPSAGIQEEAGRNYDNQTLTQLGALYENERGRMGSAAAGLGQLGSGYADNLNRASNISALPRQIEQQRLNALYDAALKTMLAPYEYNAKIANALLSEQRYMGLQVGGGLTDLGFMMTAAASAIPGSGNAGAGNPSPTTQPVSVGGGNNMGWDAPGGWSNGTLGGSAPSGGSVGQGYRGY